MRHDFPLVICGAGRNGLCALHYLKTELYKEKIVFSDCDEKKWGSTIEGVPVFSLDGIKNDFGENVVYILSGSFASEIAKELEVRGIEKKRVMYYKPRISRIGHKDYSFDVPNEFLNRQDTRVVYSFGIGEDLSFSDELMNDINIIIYAFDPTPKSIEYVNSHNLMKNVRFSFFPIGLSTSDRSEAFYLPKNENYVSASFMMHDGIDPNKRIDVDMKRYETIVKALHHDKIDLVKLDIEGLEFDVIPDIMESKWAPDYICAELHDRFFRDDNKRKNLLDKVIQKGYRDVYVYGDEILFCRGGLMRDSVEAYYEG